MAGYTERILYGFDNIVVAKVDGAVEGTGYGTPVPLLGAKSVEISIETSNKAVYADNKSVHQFILPTAGEGTLTMLGLNAEERRLLAGLDEKLVGFGLDDNPNRPHFALLFRQDVADGSHMLYCVYDVVFDLSGISLATTEEEVEEQNLEIPFTVAKGANGYFYYAVNDADADASTVVGTWFTEVPEPVKKQA